MAGRGSWSALIVIAVVVAGCLAPVDDIPETEQDPPAFPEGTYVTGRDGLLLAANGSAPELLSVTFRLSEVGFRGPEPSVGVTSSGCIFFAALHRVMRSCDAGGDWEEVQDVFSQPMTSDPYLWVDPVTDRVFNVQMVALACTWTAWSDDDGGSWLGNPWDCGPTPVNDHIKLGTGPWTAAGYGLLGGASPAYPQATYFCYNKLVGVFCYTSFDGGATFPVGGQIVGLAGGGGLHGAITTAPDGTVYVPPRLPTPTVYYSKDNGLTWSSATMGEDVGTPSPRKNSEVATDTASNGYHVWVGEDMGVYMSRSTDSGVTWDQSSIRVSPVEVVSATFPHIDAGDPGRIAVAYLGSEDGHRIGTGGESEWDGNPHSAPDETRYHLYVTMSLNALDAEPVFYTFRVTTDPVQIGSICISSGGCSDGNRNLLDFNDLHIDRDGRVYVAYADGCTGECVTMSEPAPADSRDAAGMVAILDLGPSLFEGVGLMPLL
jgi:hypothetical protein